MRRGIVVHEFNVYPHNSDVLSDLVFVFVSVDDNEVRGWLLLDIEPYLDPIRRCGNGK